MNLTAPPDDPLPPKSPLPLWVSALIVSVLLGMWLPFVFITDFYPFLRFGMFAEPVKPEQPREELQVWYGPLPALVRFNGPEVGLQPSQLRALARKYHYAGQGGVFLRRLDSLYTSEMDISEVGQPGMGQPGRWQLRKVLAVGTRADTTLLLQWP